MIRAFRNMPCISSKADVTPVDDLLKFSETSFVKGAVWLLTPMYGITFLKWNKPWWPPRSDVTTLHFNMIWDPPSYASPMHKTTNFKLANAHLSEKFTFNLNDDLSFFITSCIFGGRWDWDWKKPQKNPQKPHTVPCGGRLLGDGW